MYGANEKSLFTLSHLQQIGRKPISILKNNSCSNSLDEKKVKLDYTFLVFSLNLLPWVLGIDY